MSVAEKMTWGAVSILLSIVIFGTAFAAELEQNEDRSRGWQDREYFGSAYVSYQLGDGATAGDSGDAGAAAGAGDGGDSGTSGDGCSH